MDVKCKRTGLMASHRTFTVSTALIEHYLRRKLIFLVLPWSLEIQMCSLQRLFFFKSIINHQLFITWIFANYGLIINNFNNWYLSLKELGIHSMKNAWAEIWTWFCFVFWESRMLGAKTRPLWLFLFESVLPCDVLLIRGLFQEPKASARHHVIL